MLIIAEPKYLVIFCSVNVIGELTDFVDFLGLQSYEDPQERAEKIVEGFNSVHCKLFSAKQRMQTLLALLEVQDFESDSSKLSESDAFLEIKGLLKSI